MSPCAIERGQLHFLTTNIVEKPLPKPPSNLNLGSSYQSHLVAIELPLGTTFSQRLQSLQNQP